MDRIDREFKAWRRYRRRVLSYCRVMGDLLDRDWQELVEESRDVVKVLEAA